MEPHPLKKAIPFILVAAGLCFVAFHILVNGAAWVKSSFTKIEHPATYRFVTFDKLLHEVVKGDAVDYKLLKQSPLLDKAVNELAVVAPDKLNSDLEKFCYWVNSYNLLTLKSLSDKYPINSPRRLGNSLSFRKFTIGGDTYSVRDVMDFKLNPYFKRNPVLTFLVCEGAKGDPALLNHAIQPDAVKSDADNALAVFVNNPANTKYDEIANVFLISPYFQRYDDYFVAFYESPHMLAASKMTRPVPVEQVSLLKTFARSFDWRLNDIDSQAKPDQTADAKDAAASIAKQADAKDAAANNANSSSNHASLATEKKTIRASENSAQQSSASDNTTKSAHE